MANNGLGALAIACAWPLGTPEKKYKIDYDGKAYGDFKKALNAAYDYENRKHWNYKSRAGASCDVFVGVCARYSGADKKFPRGLDEQPSRLKNSGKWKKISADTKLQGGDVQIKSSHIRIVVEIEQGKYVAEAGYITGRFGHIENKASKSGYTTYRAVNCPSYGSSGIDAAVTKYYASHGTVKDPVLPYVAPAQSLFREIASSIETQDSALAGELRGRANALEDLTAEDGATKEDLINEYNEVLTLLKSKTSTLNVTAYISEIENRIVALQMSAEADNGNSNVYDTETYQKAKQEIIDTYDASLKSAQSKIAEIEEKLYSHDLSEYNSLLNTYNDNILDINNKIAELKNIIKTKNKDYYTLKDMIEDYQTQKTKAELSVQNFKNDNFSDQYAYWNKNVITNPAVLNFWLEFLDTEGELSQFNIQMIGDRPKAINSDSASAIYFKEIPSLIFVTSNEERLKYTNIFTGYNIVNISPSKESLFTISAQGQSIKDLLDDDLYQHGYCSEEINLTTIPIYYLEPGQIITVYDKTSNINGKYVVSKISTPLTYNGNMTITATKVPLKLY